MGFEWKTSEKSLGLSKGSKNLTETNFVVAQMSKNL